MITKEIINQAKNKDHEAFESIYAEYKDFVWNISLKISGNSSIAEDITSEVFIRLFKKINKFNFKSSFKTWLYRISVNTALNCMDKINRKKTKQLNPDYRDKIEVTDRENTRDESDIVNGLLHELNNEDRMLIVLRELEGQPYKDIAAIFKISLASVKTKIYRAREKLRNKYKEKQESINYEMQKLQYSYDK
jgi:RNA polymerase sigma-70 factor (ECF subfamily)